MKSVFLYWFLPCLLGSFIYSVFFVIEMLYEGVFHVSFFDFIIYTLAFFVISSIVISPYILYCRLVLLKLKSHNTYIIIGFIFVLLVSYISFLFIMKSAIDAVILVGSYGIIGIITIIKLLGSGYSIKNK